MPLQYKWLSCFIFTACLVITAFAAGDNNVATQIFELPELFRNNYPEQVVELTLHAATQTGMVLDEAD